MTSKSKRLAALLNSSSPLFLLGAASALLSSVPANAFDANSLPQGGTVTGGAATIAQSGNTLTVNQSSTRAVIDWRSFDIGADAQANFSQPGASSIAVNRVNASTDPTRIDGGLHANGQVWILNPNGVLFGKTARVDAAGVIATTANIDDKAFMAGDNKLQMRGGDTGEVNNEGQITVGEGGLAAFVAPSVRNSGSIVARVGKVALAAGDTYTLDLAGDRLVEIGLGAGKAVVDQSGKIVNAGGTVTISAKAAGQAVDSVINMSGVVDASAVQTAGGQILLGADSIVSTADASLKADGTTGGKIVAVANKAGDYAGSFSATGSQGDGGQVETSGATVKIASSIKVDTSAPKGKTGTWSIDPADLTVDATNVGGYESNLDTTNVNIAASNSITLSTAFDTSAQTNTNTLNFQQQTAGQPLTVNLNGAITLGAHQHLTGDGTTVNVGTAGLVQNGVDVASLLGGATVNLDGAGIYREQVVIAKGLTLQGHGATIESPDVLAHAFTSGTVDRKGVISVEGVNANINELTVDGRGQGNANSYFAGVALHNAGGTLSNLTITGVRDGGVAGTLDGGQQNAGLAVFNDTGTNTVTLVNSTITDFQKAGAVFIGHGLTADVDTNTITGVGATSVIAQNGIEFIGASGAITSNTISGISYSPDTVWASNIYLSDAAGTSVYDNTITGAGGLTGASLGIYAGASDNLDISNNSLLNLEEGIDLASTNASITGNTFKNSGTGIEAEASATGLSASGNIFTNNVTHILGSDPAGVADILANNTFDRTVVATGSASIYGDAQTAIDEEAAGSALSLSGHFGAGINVNKDGDSIASTAGAVIDAVNNGDNGVTIAANNVKVSGLEIAGAADQSYTTYAWGGDITRGIVVNSNVTGFDITGNNIHGTRNDILVNGIGNTGSITGNTIDNSKSGISIQYTDGTGIDISGNTEGQYGNEWGENLHLNGHYDSSNVYHANGDKIATTADATTQANLLASSTANSGWSIQDQGYSLANRTAVTVAATGSDANQGSALNSLATIQAGVNAVVSGGTVNVGAGTYTEQVVIAKDLNLNGAGMGMTIIASPTVLNHSFTTTVDSSPRRAVVSVEDADVNISDLTIDGGQQGSANNFFIGLGMHNASGNIENVHITNVTDTVLDGAQHGDGFAAYNDDGVDRDISLDNSLITNFQKNGAVFEGEGLFASVTNNTIIGAGGTSAIAQNGIEFINVGHSGLTQGNAGLIAGNDISALSYVPDTVWSSAILLSNAPGTLVLGNQITGEGATGGASLGLSIGNSDHVGVAFNLFQDLEEGIDISNSDDAEVFVNEFQNNGTGIEKEATATNALIGGDLGGGTSGGNLFVNNGTQILGSDPAEIADLLASNTFDKTVVATGGASIYGDVQTAIDTEAAGSALNLSASHFAAGINVNKDGDSIVGTTGTVIDAVNNGDNGITIAANNVTVSGLEIAGAADQSYLTYAWGGDITRGIVVNSGVTGFDITGNNIHGTRNNILVNGIGNTGSITGNTIDNSKSGISVQYTDGAGINIAGNAEGQYGNEWGVNLHLNGHYDSSNVYHANGDKIATTADAATQANLLASSAANGGWSIQDQGYSFANRTAVTVATTGSDANQGSALNRLATIGAGAKAVVAGGTVTVKDGTYAEDVDVAAPIKLSAGDITVNSLTLDGSAAGSVLSGNITAGSVALNGAATLGGNLRLDTSAGNGAITVASLDGGYDLAVDAGTGAVSLGNLGATARLGSVTSASDTTLTGSTYKASDFDFGGKVILTAGTTTLNTTQSATAAGDITFGADIFGTTDGAQSLVLTAGPGTGAKSANGDVTMLNAGTSAVRLGSLSVSGDDFAALTVDTAGDFNSQLTGNQLFAADTLNAAGNVNSSAAGNITGHIVSGGNVTLTSGGTVSGTLVGKVVSLTGQTVNSQVTAVTLNISAVNATVTGTYTLGKVNGGLVLNGQTVASNTVTTGTTGTTGSSGNTAGTGSIASNTGTTGSTGNTSTGNTAGNGNTGNSTGTGNTGKPFNPFGSVNGQQLVVENFALPAGTRIGADGQLLLPAGTLLGLLAPGGGTARVIMVSDVRTLGQLLAEGYVAIVIDLKNRKKAQEIKVAAN